MRLLILVSTLVLSVFSYKSSAQSLYRSEADELITVRSVTILPVFDNVRGIYARPIENHLIETLNKNHSVENSDANFSGPVVTPDELDSNPSLALQIASSIQSDSYLSTSVSKGPAGITLKMSLYLKKDGLLLSQESVSDLKSLDVDSVKQQADQLFKKIMGRLPYNGLILSRQGTRVTVNLGRKDGLSDGQMISVIQIIKLNRHPKFNFIVGAEKEVIGKVKILKVDETLSFGRIVTEKESGAIQVNSKLAGLDPVTYSNADTLSESGGELSDLSLRPENQISFGKNPIAWLPQKKPTFGQVGAHLGLAQFKESVQSTSTLEADAPYYPMVALNGELWLTPQWSIHANIRQGIISTDNPVSGGTPGDLSYSLSSYDFLFGYNMRFGYEVHSPKVEALFGYSTYRLIVDESNPSGGLSTKTYSGVKAGITGSYPISQDSQYSLGANLLFMLQSQLKEKPSSGSADNSVNTFGFFVDKKLSINMKARFNLDFELYSSRFSGGTVSSSSQKHTTVSGGLYYLF